MREHIILAIQKYWYEEIFPGVKMNSFIRDVVPIYNLIDSVGLKDGKGVIAITGESSRYWIAAYIAALLKGTTVVIVPKNLSRLELKHYLLITNTNLLITDDNNESILEKDEAFYSVPMLKGVYNSESLNWVWTTSEVFNQTLASANLTREDVILEYQDVQNFFSNVYTEDIETVITPTSGVDYPGSKYVVSSESSISALIVKSIDLLPYDMGDTIFCAVDYSTTHFLTVLLPFLKGCRFTIDPRNADIFIENTQSIEKLWRRRVDSLLEVRLFNWFFVKTPFKSLYTGLAVKRLKSYFNKGRKMKSLMILNWFGSERISAALREHLPLFTTYGSQECNQLIAYNDYSSKRLKQPNCAGKFIRGYEWKLDDDFNELLLNSKSMFIKYHSDIEWTDEVTDAFWYKTGDIAEVNSDGILYVYGRKKRLFADSEGFTINLDNMERIIKNIPYIKEVLLVSIIKGAEITFTLAVYPDEAFAESKNLSFLQLKNLIRKMADNLERDLVDDYKITRILIRPIPFNKTFDGKIESHLYPAINHG